MLKLPHKNPNTTEETLRKPFEGDSKGYIFSEETMQSLRALGEILRRIDDRLEAEKAAGIGVKRPDGANMKE